SCARVRGENSAARRQPLQVLARRLPRELAEAPLEGRQRIEARAEGQFDDPTGQHAGKLAEQV
ncbi:hypothetical protein, partial [Pseudomonas aeruginosa]